MTALPALTGPVLFDLDGTVIDSVTLIRESHRHAVRAVLGLELTDEALVVNVGRPLIEQMRHFSPDDADELFRVYREWNHANTAALLDEYDGVEDLLTALATAGRRMGIVTSKSRDAVDLAWKVLPEARRHFDVVVTADDTPRHKPSPDPVLHALEALGAGTDGAGYGADAPNSTSRRPDAGGGGEHRGHVGVFLPRGAGGGGPDSSSTRRRDARVLQGGV